MDPLSSLWGVDELCSHLNGLGIEASVLPRDSDKRPRQGLFQSDLGYVELAGWHADLVAVRIGGALSPSPDNWSTVLSVARIPLLARHVSPVQYHFIVRHEELGLVEPFRADFRHRAGLLSGRGGGLPRWEGGTLAYRLDADEELKGRLAAALAKHDSLAVRADARGWCVRVAWRSRLVFHFSLVPKPEAELDRGLPSREALDAIGGVLVHVRRLVDERS